MFVCRNCHHPLVHHDGGYYCPSCHFLYPETDNVTRLSQAEPSGEQFFPENVRGTLNEAESRHFWFQERNALIRDTVLRYLPAGARGLEIGCGSGHISRSLSSLGYHVDCADISIEALRHCQAQSKEGRCYLYNACDYVFSEEFQSIFAFDVLEHVSDDTLVLRNISRALVSGGKLFVTVPAIMSLWSPMDEYACHKRRYTIKELKEKMESEGFEVVKISYFMMFLLPLFVFRRWWMKMFRSFDNPQRQIVKELRVYPLVNTLFSLVMKGETRLIRRINLPVGSSIIAVAVKKGCDEDTAEMSQGSGQNL